MGVRVPARRAVRQAVTPSIRAQLRQEDEIQGARTVSKTKDWLIELTIDWFID